MPADEVDVEKSMRDASQRVQKRGNAEQMSLSELVRSLDAGAELMEQYRGRFTFRLPSQGACVGRGASTTGGGSRGAWN
jgi:hypothetical protein